MAQENTQGGTIFSRMFAPKQQQQNNQQPPGSQQQEPAKDDKNQTTQDDGKMKGSNQKLGDDKNPLDSFAGLYDTSKHKEEDGAPAFVLDDKILGDVAGSMDFTKDLPPELLADIEANKPGAMLKAINLAGQAAYKAALSHGASITGKYLDHRSSHDNNNVGRTVDSKFIDKELSSLPNANHPVVKAEISRISTLMRRDNPDASPQEIAAGVKEYMTQLGNAFSGKEPPEDDKSQPGAVDWKKYVNQGSDDE